MSFWIELSVKPLHGGFIMVSPCGTAMAVSKVNRLKMLKTP